MNIINIQQLNLYIIINKKIIRKNSKALKNLK